MLSASLNKTFPSFLLAVFAAGGDAAPAGAGIRGAVPRDGRAVRQSPVPAGVRRRHHRGEPRHRPQRRQRQDHLRHAGRNVPVQETIPQPLPLQNTPLDIRQKPLRTKLSILRWIISCLTKKRSTASQETQEICMLLNRCHKKCLHSFPTYSTSLLTCLRRWRNCLLGYLTASDWTLSNWATWLSEFLPPDIFKTPNLEELTLKNLFVKSLPTEWPVASKLTRLTLSGLQLELLPPEISSLQELVYLDLNYNPLKDLPMELEKLQKLKYLSVCGMLISNNNNNNNSNNNNDNTNDTKSICSFCECKNSLYFTDNFIIFKKG